MQTQSIKNLIQEEFLKRLKSNKSYSMRAYAKSLGIDQSLLSKIMRGERELTVKMAMRLSHSLGLSTEETSQKLKQDRVITNEFKKIQEDVFVMMSDWYHFALLELIKLDDFQNDLNWMARTLGVKAFEIKLALERLERLGFIEINPEQIELIRTDNEWFNYQNTNHARKMMQKQLLHKAIEAIDEVDFQQRVNSSLTFSLNENDLPLFKEKMKEFISEISSLEESLTSEKTHVYQLCNALYPLSRSSK